MKIVKKYYLKTCKEDLTHFPEWGFLKGKVKQEKINLTAFATEASAVRFLLYWGRDIKTMFGYR